MRNREEAMIGRDEMRARASREGAKPASDGGMEGGNGEMQRINIDLCEVCSAARQAEASSSSSGRGGRSGARKERSRGRPRKKIKVHRSDNGAGSGSGSCCWI